MNDLMTTDVVSPSEIKLAEHAEVIRTLGKRMAHGVVEIGRQRSEGQLVGHGGWLPLAQVSDAAGKMDKFGNLDLPISGLCLIATRSPFPCIDGLRWVTAGLLAPSIHAATLQSQNMPS